MRDLGVLSGSSRTTSGIFGSVPPCTVVVDFKVEAFFKKGAYRCGVVIIVVKFAVKDFYQ